MQRCPGGQSEGVKCFCIVLLIVSLCPHRRLNELVEKDISVRPLRLVWGLGTSLLG